MRPHTHTHTHTHTRRQLTENTTNKTQEPHGILQRVVPKTAPPPPNAQEWAQHLHDLLGRHTPQVRIFFLQFFFKKVYVCVCNVQPRRHSARLPAFLHACHIGLSPEVALCILAFDTHAHALYTHVDCVYIRMRMTYRMRYRLLWIVTRMRTRMRMSMR